MKNFIVGAVIIGLCIIIGIAFFGGKTTIEYGASPGPDHYNFETFYNGLRGIKLSGGGDVTTLTANATTVTMTAAEVCDSAIIEWAPGDWSGVATATFPSGQGLSTSTCLANTGDYKEFLFRNIAPAASTSIFVAGASTTMLSASSTDYATIAGAVSVGVKILKATSTEYIITLEEMTAAD